MNRTYLLMTIHIIHKTLAKWYLQHKQGFVAVCS